MPPSPVDTRCRPSVAVVGGGITGLVAALTLTKSSAPAVEVSLFEAANRFGGKIHTRDFEGRSVDAGPDAFIARVPEGRELACELGLEDELVSPADRRAYLWTRGKLRPLPAGLVLGVPSRLLPMMTSGSLSLPGRLRLALEPLVPARRSADNDQSVASLVARRLGWATALRLADPVVGGIHAGDTKTLSSAATAPMLHEANRRPGRLIRNLRAEADTGPTSGPVFWGLRTGMSTLVSAVVQRVEAAGGHLHIGTAVGSMKRTGTRWDLALDGEIRSFDAVVLATPAPVSAMLLSDVAPSAAALLGGIPHASVALLTMSYPAAAVGLDLSGSGFLVPRPEGRLITACTWMSSKWPHAARPGHVLVRASVGRHGDARALAMDEADLVEKSHRELASAMSISGPPGGVEVSRWDNAFPQYEVGHLGRVAEIEGVVAQLSGVELAGAALRGIGIPACIAQGRQAAIRALSRLRAG